MMWLRVRSCLVSIVKSGVGGVVSFKVLIFGFYWGRVFSSFCGL